MTIDIKNINDTRSIAARRRMETEEGGPFLVCDQERVLVVHYHCAPALLQPHVLFALDTWEGLAWVSVLAGISSRPRVATGGRLVHWAHVPAGPTAFLQVCVCVRHQGEAGLHPLARWANEPADSLLGLRLFDPPSRQETFNYLHHHEHGEISGTVGGNDGAARLAYVANGGHLEEGHDAAPGSLEEFLLERYAVFTCRGAVQRRCQLWHQPWLHSAADLVIEEDSLLRGLGLWAAGLRYAGATYAPHQGDVWYGRPCCVNGPACGRVWRLNGRGGDDPRA